MNLLDEPTVNNLTREELLHYAEVDGDALTKRVVRLLAEGDVLEKSEIAHERDQLEEEVDSLQSECQDLEDRLAEADRAIQAHIEKLENLAHEDEIVLREKLMVYIEELREY